MRPHDYSGRPGGGISVGVWTSGGVFFNVERYFSRALWSIIAFVMTWLISLICSLTPSSTSRKILHISLRKVLSRSWLPDFILKSLAVNECSVLRCLYPVYCVVRNIAFFIRVFFLIFFFFLLSHTFPALVKGKGIVRTDDLVTLLSILCVFS